MAISDGASDQTLNIDGRDRDTTGLYRVLGVEPNATQLELKRAYRRLALQYHPDRNPGTASHFVRIQHAYDVLSDERMRRIYDRYGDIGVQMAGRMGGELLDPHVSNLLSGFAFASSLVSLLLIAFLALLARRVDHAISWPYSVVFAPLWTIDVCLLAGITWAILKQAMAESGSRRTQNTASFGNSGEEEEAATDSGGEGSSRTSSFSADMGASEGQLHADIMDSSEPSSERTNAGVLSRPATDSTPLLVGPQRGEQGSHRWRRSRRQQLRKLRKLAEARLASLAKVAPAAYIVLLVAFQLSVVLRADGYVDWPAWRVAVPWFSIEAIHGLLLTLQLAASLLKASERAVQDESQPKLTLALALAIALDNYWWLLIRASQALLIVLKLDGCIAAASWALVFTPSYLPAIRSAISLCLLRRQLRAMGDAEVAQNESAIVLSFAGLFVFVSSFVYSFVALLIWKLSLPSAVRLALVFIPAFVALSLACCCCTWISCCLAYGMHAPLDDEESPEPADAMPISSDRRIQ